MKKMLICMSVRYTYGWLLLMSLLFVTIIFPGCIYFKVMTKTNVSGTDLLILQQGGKHFILHANDSVWHLLDFQIQDSNATAYSKFIDTEERVPIVFSPFPQVKTDTGVKSLSPYSRVPQSRKERIVHRTYRMIVPNKSGPYRAKRKHGGKSVLKEVHIYSSEKDSSVTSRISFPVKTIQKIDIYEFDKKASVNRTSIKSAIAFTVISGGVTGIVYGLSNISCPLIYIKDGDKDKLCGDIYAGSIQPQLERNDYLLLDNIQPQNDEYVIRMSNQFQEIQNTNLMEFLVFDHDSDIRVLVDKYGKHHAIKSPQPPLNATDGHGNDFMKEISKEDELYCYTREAGVDDYLDEVIIKFDLPSGVKNAKLIIRAKNSGWMEYVLKEFYYLFGKSYRRFQEKQKAESPETLRQWVLSQNIPLSVYIETNGKWEYIDYFNLSGGVLFRENVLPLDLSGISEGPLKIKLESGAFFWHIDYAAIDYSRSEDPKITLVPIKSATTNKSQDIRNLLNADDMQYYTQPEVGDEAILTFDVPPAENPLSRTVFLHSKGYYQMIIDPKGNPDKKMLETFREPGRFPKFSIELLHIMSEHAKK